MVGVMAVTATSFKRPYTSMLQVPVLLQSVPLAHTSARDSHRILALYLEGSLLPGSWYAQSFVVPPRVCFPVLWRFCNQIPLASKVKFPGGSQSFARSPGQEICCGCRVFITVWGLLWFNCSPVYWSSARWLYGGANGDILPEDLR